MDTRDKRASSLLDTLGMPFPDGSLANEPDRGWLVGFYTGIGVPSGALPGSIYTESVLLRGYVVSTWSTQLIATDGYGQFGGGSVCPMTLAVTDTACVVGVVSNATTVGVVDNATTIDVTCP